MKSKWKPTTKELGQLARIYQPMGTLVFGKNGMVSVRRK
jgi:hypothetical protein